MSGDKHRAKDYLDSFVKNNFPRGRMLELMAGGVPVCQPLCSTVSDGLMIVGDAARVVDPITGGGIYNAMYTGRLAAEVATGSISMGDCSSSALASYDKKWRDSPIGEGLKRNYKFKEYLINLSDEKLNKLAHSASKLNLKEFSIMNLVRELLLKNPGMLWDIRSLFPNII